MYLDWHYDRELREQNLAGEVAERNRYALDGASARRRLGVRSWHPLYLRNPAVGVGGGFGFCGFRNITVICGQSRLRRGINAAIRKCRFEGGHVCLLRPVLGWNPVKLLEMLQLRQRLHRVAIRPIPIGL